jgi:chromosome segregation ATPase
MARTGISFEQVTAAADALVGRGEKATIQAVRDEIGTGSPNTIHKHLAAWKAMQIPSERKAVILPDELAKALANEIERQASAARAEAESDALEARQTADELAETGEALEAEADDLRAQVEQLTAERDEAVSDRSEARKLVTEFREHVKALETQRDDARFELAEARNRIVTLSESLDRERSATLDAQAALKQADTAKVEAERAQAVAIAKLEGLQEQAVERLEALKYEQHARSTDAETHRRELVELRDDWKERLAMAEKHALDAQKRAQEAETAKVKSEAKLSALEAQKLDTKPAASRNMAMRKAE